MCDQSTQTDQTFDEVSNSSIEIHIDSPSEHEETDTLSPRKDPSFVPSKCVEVLWDDSLSDTDDAKEAKPHDDVKFIVFKQNLYELFKWCPECGSAVQKNMPPLRVLSCLLHWNVSMATPTYSKASPW